MTQENDRPAWLAALENRTPVLLKKFEIHVLMQLTASACREKAPSLKGLDASESLAAYRAFTVRALTGKSREELLVCRRSLYRRSFRIGRFLGALPGLNGKNSKKRLITLLYKNIDITIRFVDSTIGFEDEKNEKDRTADCHAAAPSCITIPHCCFSALYTPQICHIMSGLDAGIICGILGADTLHFSRRLTEGCPDCRAVCR